MERGSYYSPRNQGILEQQVENFKVVIRIRPPLPREHDEYNAFQAITQVDEGEKVVQIIEYLGAETTELDRARDMQENPCIYTIHQFTFDYVYDQDANQQHVYECTAKGSVQSVLEGYNATVLAYGQTGTGKTYTMEGFKYTAGDPQRGIIPRSMEDIFLYIENCIDPNTTFMVRASYLQIYNENISDLLKAERTSLTIREDKKRGVFVEGLSEWAVRSPSDIYSLMHKGAQDRATACTKMNDISSRSHAVFIIVLEHMVQNIIDGEETGGSIRMGKLNLVDLAGSERVRISGSTGKRLEETKKINQSLSALGNVIAALTSQKPRAHIPYRDSKLTRLLEDSLGGNCKTTFMAMISPAHTSFAESLSTLKFANRAKNIRNQPRINEDVDSKALLRRYEIELKKLREQLSQKAQHVVDIQQLMQLEEEKRRAEEDKEAAIVALESRSREFMKEKEEKKKLEEKIKMMSSQVLKGGVKIEDTPQFRTALEQKQQKIRQEYEKKLQDLERERQNIEEDKAQVDRYKQLLLKQRDIMIALTARLNERDETIIQLQEELDAYDKIHKEAEDQLEIKAAYCEHLEQVMISNNVPLPKDFTVVPQNLSPREKRYLPYQEDNIMIGDLSMPLSMLNADEKIKELVQVADKQQSEVKRLQQELSKVKKQESELQKKQQEIEKTNKEKQTVQSILENNVSRLMEKIINSVQQNKSMEATHIQQDLTILQKYIQTSITTLSGSSKNVQLHIPNYQKTTTAPSSNSGSFLSSQASQVSQTPENTKENKALTVEEMIAQKRMELKKWKEQNGML